MAGPDTTDPLNQDRMTGNIPVNPRLNLRAVMYLLTDDI